MLFETLEPRVLLSADLNPIQGSIAVPGETDRYTFTLSQEKQILFDSETPNSSLNWSLAGPQGNVVSNRSFTASDLVDASNVVPLDLVSGNYTLSVKGLADTTGNYQFRLLDLANATTIVPGTAVTGALNPGNETNLYQFNANSGDQFYFDSQTVTGATSSTQWSLLDPNHRVLWSNSLTTDVGTQALPSSGVYTLLVEGGVYNTNPITYSFNAQNVTNTTAALPLGTQVNGAITQTGQQNAYTFNLANASQLYFDSLTSDSNFNWTLTGPRGAEVSSQYFYASDGNYQSRDPVLNLIAGNYTLTVATYTDHTGGYSFRLSDLGSATSITPGTAVSGTLNPGNATNLYKFNANAGDPFYFDGQTASGGSTYWRLIDPNGQQVWFNGFGDVATQALPSSGTYSLLVEGYIYNTTPVTFSFNAQSVANTTAALTLGSQVNGAVTQAGQQNLYTFNLANPSQLYFDSLTNDSSLSWTLTGPRGIEVNTRSFTGSDSSSIANSVLSLIAGNYTLAVSGTTSHTGSYSFRLSDLASATAITLGNPISGTLSSGTNTNLYKFDALAGDQIALNRQALNGGNPYWRVIDPYGEVTYAATFGNSGTLTLPLAGTYTLLFEGQISANGATDYTFNVSSQGHVTLTPPTGTVLSLGALTSGAISTVSQQNNYIFSISSPTNLYFDSQTNLGGLNWSLIGPQGTLVSNRSFQSSDAGSFGSSSPIFGLIVPGTYQLRVQGNGSTTGSYNFRLSDLASAASITPGTVVSGTLSPGNATNLYKFNASAGDQFYFDQLTGGGYPNYWRLIDPYGQQVWSTYFGTPYNVDTQTLALPGTYTLLVEGYITNTSPVNYSFNVQKVTNTTAALTLGSQVNGAVTQPGQQNFYSFNLANPSQLYFDSLTSDGSLSWTLTGPGGIEVSPRTFSSSDAGSFSTSPILNLISGNYTLTVAGNADHTGSYSFRLSNLMSATAITPGIVVSGTLNPGNATNLYQFNANSGDLFYFDLQNPSSTSPYWRLLDPYGRQVWYNSAFSDVPTQALPFDGTYTLLIEGGISVTTPVTYSFNAQKVTNTTAALTLGTQVNGAITQTGQQNAYTFNLANPSQLYFDSLTSDTNFNWTLTGPRGTEVSSQYLYASDGNYQSSDPVLNLIAGNYTLTVSGTTDHTGSYGFRLSDLASATSITPGTVVSGTLSPGNATNIYKFSANAGDPFYFDEQSASSTTYWRLIDPLGRQVWSNGFGDVATQPLTLTGTYTLLVEGYIFNTSPVNYSFNAQKITNTTVALTLGTPVNGAITQPGQQNAYIFNLANASQLYFDSLTSDSNFNWTLTGPRGTEVSSQYFYASDGNYQSSDPIINLIAGNYTLTVFGTTSYTGSYGFRLSDLGSATSITPGTAVSGTLNPGNATNLYKFDANAGDLAYFDQQTANGNTYWRLIDPNGQQVWFNSFGDVATQALPSSGTYSLLVEGYIYNTTPVNYSFNVQKVTNTTTALTLGSQVNGSITQPAVYTFSLANPASLYFDSLTSDSNFNWTLTGPRGTEVTSRYFYASDGNYQASDPVLNLIAGSYTLFVAGGGGSTNFSFRLSDLGSATSITPGTAVSGTLNPGNATNLYKFDANAGDLAYFDQQTANGNTYWRLIDPNGQQVWFNGFGDVATQALPSSGTYSLLVEGYIYNTTPVNYSFNVQKVTNTTTALTLGSQVNGSITQPAVYTFSLANPASLYFDSLTSDSNFNWTLTGPRGTEVTSRYFYASDGNYQASDPVLNLIAGSYTLFVAGGGGSTNFSFRLSDLGSATSITPGTAVSGTLNPGNATNLYKFNANAGDPFYFDGQTASGGSTYWRLIDPNGQQVWFNGFGDVATQALPSSGTYSLLVEGYIYNTTPVTFSFNAQSVANTTAALTLGSQVNGAVTQAGQQNLYTFNLANPSQLYFDSLTNDSSLSWTLTGPRGIEVNTRSFTGSDSSSIANSVLSLIAGNYTLAVSGTTSHTGSYSFRLSDLASATAITLGNPISGTLSSGTNTNLYKFDALAGDQIALNRQALNGGNPYWRVIDPYGEVTYAATFGNSGTLTLPLAGTYTLLFEGQISANGATDYTFNVSSQGHVTLTPPTGTVLSLGALTSGAISTVSQQNNYIFSISSPTNLYFDSQTNLGGLNWSLIGPQGTLVSNRSFQSSDAGSFGSSSPIFGLIVPGTYQLRVQGNGSTTGSYNFRLSDLASAAPITPGTLVSGTLSPGTATNLYQFNATAGDPFYFDQQSASSGNTYWRLIDPYGQQVWFNGFSDVATQQLALTGTYTLLVEGYAFNTTPVTYSFNAQKVTNTAVALTLGTQVNGTVTQPGQQNLYTFNLANPTSLHFDSLTNDSSLSWTLIGPRGTEGSSRNFTNSDAYYANSSNYPAALNLIAGNYTLTVAGTTDHTGSYSFRLSDLASATAIAPGTRVSGTLTPGNATNLYKFSANAGDPFYFDEQSISGSIYNNYWRLLDPNGHQVWFQYPFADVPTSTLALTGTYTLLVEGDISNTTPVNYSFNVQNLTTAVPLTLGTQVDGSITQPAVYSFNLANPTSLYFDSLTNDGSLSWTLTGPRGTEVSSRSFTNSDGYSSSNNDPFALNLIAGNYTLTVAGTTDQTTGSFSFRLSDLASATAIAPGTRVSGTLTPGNATNLYKFSANAGDPFYFDEQSISGSIYNNYWRLLDPNGHQVWFQYPFADVPTSTLALTGTYTLLVEGDISNTTPVNYSFNVQNLTTAVPLTLGTQVDGSITQPAVYSFNLANPTSLYFDSLTNDGSLSWTLTGPRGTEVSSRSFTNSDGYSSSNNDPFALNLIAGNYTLTVAGTTGPTTGSFSFRLSDLASATVITPGTPVSGTLTPGNATNLYKFSANAGDPFYFDQQSILGSMYNNYWRLLDPNGRQVWFQYPFADVPTSTLALTGTYTLLVEGDVSNTTPVNYSFNADFVPLAAPIQIAGLGLQPSPDLVVTGLAVSSSGPLQSGSEVTVIWNDVNNGNQATAASWSDQILVRNASNQVIANLLVPYDQSVSGSIAAGGVSQRQATVRLPDGLSGAGAITFSVIADALNAIAEQSASGDAETNNTTSLTVTSALAPYADLQVTNLTVDPSDAWAPGSNVTLHWNTFNAGNLATQSSWSEQISVRNLSTGASLVLATIPYDASITGNGPLAPGASQTRQYSLTWPSGLSSTGKFEFAVTTDSQNQIFEANGAGTAETNNTSLVDIASAPDLQIGNLAVTSSPVQAGSTLTLAWSDINSGTMATPAGWYDHIVVTNTTTGQQLIDAAVFFDPNQAGNGPLGSGQSVARSFSFNLPDGLQGAGSLNITVTGNRNQNNTASLIEAANGTDATTNNQSSITVQSLTKAYPDLSVSNFTAPASGSGGDQVQVGWTVTNLGTVTTAASQWVDRVILSTDAVFGNADDVTLAEFAHSGSLAAGQSYGSSQTVTLPLQKDGNFYITVRTDAGGAVVEPDTQSNNYAPALQVSLAAPFADLAVQVVVGPASGNSGEPISLSWRVANVGTSGTVASTWKDRVVLSADAVFDPSDIVLGDVTHNGSLAPGENYVGQATLQLPNGVSGQFSILVVSDIGGQVYEKGLTQNNTGVSINQIAVAPAPSADLAVTQIVAPAGGVPGQQLDVTWTVQNVGAGAALAPWVDRVYLSTDGTLNGAILLASVQRNFDLAPGASSTVAASVVLPDKADSNYEIFVVTDADNQVYEPGNKTNNTAVVPLALVHPDLAPSGVTVTPDVLNSGESASVSWTVNNVGTGPALGSWTDTLYLSRGNVVGPNDIKLGDFVHTGQLGSGGSYLQQVNVIMPLGASGSYNILVVTNSASGVHEVGALANNVAGASIQVALSPFADLAVSNVTAPAITIGDPAAITVGWTVTNVGTGVGQTTSWQDAVLISLDDIVGNADDQVLAKLFHNGGLAVGASYSESQKVFLPIDASNRYHLFVVSDFENTVFENSSKSNNAAEPAHTLDVMPIPYADLVVSSVTADANANSGGALHLSWTVTNQGIGITSLPSWTDSVALVSAAGVTVATYSFDHLGNLAPNGSYVRSGDLAVPNGISGEFHVVVAATSSSGQPYEFIYTGNNSTSSAPINVALSPSPDLVVSDIQVPQFATEGDFIDVSWTVSNTGQAAATGSWRDQVVLQPVGRPDLSLLPVGTFTHIGDLGPGLSYTRTERFLLPDKTEGIYVASIVTNVDGAVYEYGDAAKNNRLIDAGTLSVQLRPRPDLQVDSAIVPPSVPAGGTASLSFTIVNQGTVATTTPHWKDAVYLSLDGQLTPDDILVGTFDNGAALGPGRKVHYGD
ncbi:CARDB domain-containing protein [Bradyrhizobium sp. AZCC 2289]|uniref:CARDB domain-containing protein n=1 Tax=Bradyrhizobium sp. AZCC 2289 TaxID=3117026 RepID=UPI002FF17406